MNVPISTIVGGNERGLRHMTWDEYREFPALNGSCLVEGRKSMLHLKYAWDHGRKDTDSMQFGRLLHCLLFEPKEVESRYVAWEGRRAGNDYKAFCDEAEANGAEVIRADGEYSLATALEAAQGFLRSDRVQGLISSGQAEQSVLSVECGLQCKGRLDWVSASEHILTDLKTTAEIEPTLFGRSFFRFGYDLKLGLYRRWLNAVTNDQWPVEVIVLENHPPYDVAVVPVPDAVLDNGVEKALEIIGRVATAIEADQWPGIAAGDFAPLAVPYHEMVEDTLKSEVKFSDEV